MKDKCSRCGKVIELYEPYQEDEDGVKTHIYPERYCRKIKVKRDDQVPRVRELHARDKDGNG